MVGTGVAVGTGVEVGGATVVDGRVVVTGGRVVGFAVDWVDGRDVGGRLGEVVPEEGRVCDPPEVGAVPVAVVPAEGVVRSVRVVVGRDVSVTVGVAVRDGVAPVPEMLGIV